MQARFVVPVALLALAACSGGGSSSHAVSAVPAIASRAVDRSGDAPPAGRSVAIERVAIDGAAPARGPFAPVTGPLAYRGPTAQGKPEIDLFATAGGGSSAAFSVAEPGWSNVPSRRQFTVSAGAGCARIATVRPARGTAFTVRAVASPVAGSCVLAVADGLGHSLAVTVTYAATTFSAS